MAAIVGWSHSKFGKSEESLEDLIAKAASDAVHSAGIGFADVDAIYLGNFGGFEKQGFPASFVLDADPALRFKPATRIENACATGTAAIHTAINAIRARNARFVLVVGAERMTTAPGELIGDILLNASYRKEEGDTPGGFAGIFGRIAELYFQRHGDQSEALAMIAAKNHKNGVANPYAQLRKELTVEFCNTVSDKNPLVAGPLRRTDCSLVSDGAAALVLCDTETALRFPRAVHFRAVAHAQDFLPISRRDIVAFEGCGRAWQLAHERAGTTIEDLSFVETHDCFTIAELIEYETMGLTAPGQGATAIREGWTAKAGKLPVNPSGGLKSKGHPIGATGVSMHVMAALQLLGEAGDMQVRDAKLAGIFNMGGAAVANHVSILERLR
ncbi:MAG: acetyl-CoA acetyltransferase [Rhizobiales bacterium]|nr:acetyl-CoA acetyltransferase [Hyphomicrobiales bacterium]